MVTLSDALAAEREKRRNLEEDALARKQVARAVLSSLADKLNATQVSGGLRSRRSSNPHVPYC